MTPPTGQEELPARSCTERSPLSIALLGVLTLVVVLLATLACAPSSPPREGSSRLTDVRVLAEFDKRAGQNAENVAPESDGGAIVGMIGARQVVRVARNGAVTVLATMPLPADGGRSTPRIGYAMVTGVATGRDGSVFFLYSAGRGGLTGVWRLAPASSEPQLIVPMDPETFLNGLVVDQVAQRFLVTDSINGRIWQAPLRGGAATIWSRDPLLAPTRFLGANGLKVHKGAVWTSNYDRGTIVRIPVEATGAAGPAAVHASHLPGVDDFDFTNRGEEILAALNDSNEVVAVAGDGTSRALLDGSDGLQGTTAIAVQGHVVYITSGALLQGERPSLLTAELSGAG